MSLPPDWETPTQSEPFTTHTVQPLDVKDVDDELRRAMMHGLYFASLHEAYAVIEEELDEIHDLMRMKRRDRKREDIRKELIQLAAMAHKALASIHNFVGGDV